MAWSTRDRRKAIELAAEVGVRAAARQLGIPYRTIAGWMEQEGPSVMGANALESAAAAEAARKQTELSQKLIDVAENMLDLTGECLQRARGEERAADVLALVKAADLLASRLFANERERQSITPNPRKWEPPAVAAEQLADEPDWVSIPATLIDP